VDIGSQAFIECGSRPRLTREKKGTTFLTGGKWDNKKSSTTEQIRGPEGARSKMLTSKIPEIQKKRRTLRRRQIQRKDKLVCAGGLKADKKRKSATYCEERKSHTQTFRKDSQRGEEKKREIGL